jgi:hypothetical protein
MAASPQRGEEGLMAHDEQAPDEQDEALSVLRGIWTAQRHTGADLDAPSSTKACKNMKNIGFGGDAGPVDDDLRSAWRERLAREGKIAPGSSSVRDLVLGPENG